MENKQTNNDVTHLLLQAREFVGRSLSHAKNNTSGIAPVLSEFMQTVHQRILQRDSENDGRSWQLAPATKYGAWFETAPLEILPEAPPESMSDILQQFISTFDNWALKEGALSIEKVFKELFNSDFLYSCSRSDRLHIQWLGLALLSLDWRPWTRDVIYNLPTPIHSDPHIRSLILSLAFIDLPWVPAERYLYSCTHDTDELVFIKAFRIVGYRHDERAMDHLSPIVRSPATVLEVLYNNKMYYPVGHAACNICPAQFAILGTDHPEIAKQREQELSKRLRRPLSEPVEHAREKLKAAIENFQQPAPLQEPPVDLEKMVKIPAGTFKCGMNPSDVAEEVFDWSTCVPMQEIHVEEFYMDPYPVTNAEYDAWVALFASLSKEEQRFFEHPGQKKGKEHRRNTYDDPRFKPNHPIVGIDWFDAWAYARYHGKDLPTELQWEKAARGTEGRRYPWGTDFNAKAVRFADETYGIGFSNLLDWVIYLNRGSKQFPLTTTAAIDAHPEGVSPYGIYDMCGNCWEFTKTAFFTRKNVRPAFADFTPIELMGSQEGHVVIRGGAWSSPAPLIGAAYRGYDLLTDRHTEIGFRCVWNPLP